MLLTNKTGAATVKGNVVTPSLTVDNAVILVPINEPDGVGVFLHSGVADGAEAWVVVSGLAEVYFSGSATRGHMARVPLDADVVKVSGEALSEAYPTSPFASDKHFAEIGHVLQSRTGAGLTMCILHFN